MGQGEEHMAGDHVEDREGEDVMDERGAGPPSDGEEVNWLDRIARF